MKIVINSHKNSSIALNHLLESMKIQENFKNYHIIICIGGFYENNQYYIETNENITYIKCYHNSIDFTGLITLFELYRMNETDYYFYLHDTCKVGSNFFNKLNLLSLDIHNENISSMRITKNASMNIGIYSQKLINGYEYFFQEIKNTVEANAMKLKQHPFTEDYIFNSDNNNKVIDNYNIHDVCNKCNISEPVNYYNTGVLRIVEYYPNVDLYKMKANWGQGIWILDN